MSMFSAFRNPVRAFQSGMSLINDYRKQREEREAYEDLLRTEKVEKGKYRHIPGHPHASGPGGVDVPRGPLNIPQGGPNQSFIGADPYVEGLQRRGFSEAQIDEAQRNRLNNIRDYGTANPGFGDFYSAASNTENAKTFGLAGAGADALSLAGAGGVSSVLKPAIAATRPAQVIHSVTNRALANPVVNVAANVAHRVTPAFSGATTPQGQMVQRLGNRAVAGGTNIFYNPNDYGNYQALEAGLAAGRVTGFAPHSSRNLVPIMSLIGAGVP